MGAAIYEEAEGAGVVMLFVGVLLPVHGRWFVEALLPVHGRWFLGTSDHFQRVAWGTRQGHPGEF